MDIDGVDAHELVFKPVTESEWADMQELFAHCPFRGCWCMYWRMKRKEFDQHYGETNRLAMERLIHSGQVPGILAYHDGRPIGWCSVAPREEFSALQRSRTLKRVDDTPVWSIVCFLLARDFRGQGLTRALIQGAMRYAQSRGAHIVEAYPMLPEESKRPKQSSYMGMASTFLDLGFVQVARASKMRLIVRYTIPG